MRIQETHRQSTLQLLRYNLHDLYATLTTRTTFSFETVTSRYLPNASRALAAFCRDHELLMLGNVYQSASTLSDREIIERVLNGATDLYEIIIRRYHHTLVRITWAIVKDDQETEDIVQETYVIGYEHLRQFAGRSRLSTWLAKIAVHEACNRVKRRTRERHFDGIWTSMRKTTQVNDTPEDALLTAELRTFLKQSIEALPEAQR